jgi:hyperosmotically inducible periplasmic protein
MYRTSSSRMLVAAAAAAGILALAACSPEDRREARSDANRTATKVENAVSDSAITAKVKSAFLADPTVKGLNINVDTNNGVVALKGQVSGPTERQKAIQIARSVEGVRDVNDQLTN